MVTVLHGDCLDVLAGMDEASIDAVVTDPPYEYGFMGATWDSTGIAYQPATWAAVHRVLKPGGHLLAFGGTRTYHRLAVAIEDAGFEVRDSIGLLGWCYGSGFPKSLDVGKAIDKAAGAEREIIRPRTYELANDGGYSGGLNTTKPRSESAEISAPATDEAHRWDGWGTALKPAWEPIVVARKPLSGTVAANVVEHGTGALNIDGCRVGTDMVSQHGRSDGQSGSMESRNYAEPPGRSWVGRWPTNLLLSHHPECVDGGPCHPWCHVAEMDRQSGNVKAGGSTTTPSRTGPVYGTPARGANNFQSYADEGGASRFFPVFRYQAKAGRAERPRGDDGTLHPTVKPLALMRWLVRLVCPPGGQVLDPFAGSGTTGEAAILEGFRAVLVERDERYLPLIAERLDRHSGTLFGLPGA